MRRALLAGVLALAMVAGAFGVLVVPARPPATILMYHTVLDGPHALDTSIAPALFRRQMQFVAGRVYETVFVRDVVARHASGMALPPHWLALTFDGGYGDFYTDVYPVLRQHRLKATLFVIVADIGIEGGLTWAQLRELSASGLVEIGSHSFDHVADHCLSEPQARGEKVHSRAVLEGQLGVPVVTYAYPYGAFSERAKRLLQEAGYRGAVGTVYRRGEFPDDDVFNLRRVYVSGVSRLPLMFRFMLSGYYVPSRALILRTLGIKTPRQTGCRPSGAPGRS